MKKFLMLLIAVLSLSIFSISSAFAADNLKIGMINLQGLMQKLPQMKQINEDMKKQFSDRESKIISSQTTLKKDVDDFKRNNAVMAEKDRQAAEEKLVKQDQELQKMKSSFQKDYMDAQNKRINALLMQIKGIVEKIAARDNFDLVLVDASIAYKSNKILDITDQVSKEIK